jgi:hypothetical protein
MRRPTPIGAVKWGKRMAMDQIRLLTDRYRLVERLGAGGMSVVWRGFATVDVIAKRD